MKLPEVKASRDHARACLTCQAADRWRAPWLCCAEGERLTLASGAAIKRAKVEEARELVAAVEARVKALREEAGALERAARIVRRWTEGGAEKDERIPDALEALARVSRASSDTTEDAHHGERKG